MYTSRVIFAQVPPRHEVDKLNNENLITVQYGGSKQVFNHNMQYHRGK